MPLRMVNAKIKEGEPPRTEFIHDYTFDVPANKWEKVGAVLKD